MSVLQRGDGLATMRIHVGQELLDKLGWRIGEALELADKPQQAMARCVALRPAAKGSKSRTHLIAYGKVGGHATFSPHTALQHHKAPAALDRVELQAQTWADWLLLWLPEDFQHSTDASAPMPRQPSLLTTAG